MDPDILHLPPFHPPPPPAPPPPRLTTHTHTQRSMLSQPEEQALTDVMNDHAWSGTADSFSYPGEKYTWSNQNFSTWSASGHTLSPVAGTLKLFIPPRMKPRREVCIKKQNGDCSWMRKYALNFADEKYFNDHSTLVCFMKISSNNFFYSGSCRQAYSFKNCEAGIHRRLEGWVKEKTKLMLKQNYGRVLGPGKYLFYFVRYLEISTY